MFNVKNSWLKLFLVCSSSIVCVFIVTEPWWWWWRLRGPSPCSITDTRK